MIVNDDGDGDNGGDDMDDYGNDDLEMDGSVTTDADLPDGDTMSANNDEPMMKLESSTTANDVDDGDNHHNHHQHLNHKNNNEQMNNKSNGDTSSPSSPPSSMMIDEKDSTTIDSSNVPTNLENHSSPASSSSHSA